MLEKMLLEKKALRLLPLSAAISMVLHADAVFAAPSQSNTEAGSAGLDSAPNESDTGEEVLEEVYVTGIRSSLNRSLLLKQNAQSIQDSIVAEDIGKFPDQNVAESLQRVTGVSISRTNGEGAKVTVRGFGPEFNVVRVNNRTLATTEEGREFDFQILPSELISGADIVKSPTASTAEGSIGAYINIKTAKPLDSPGFQAASSIQMRYNDLADESDPKVSGVISNTFADDTIGVILGISYEESHNRIDATGGTRWGKINAGDPGIVDGDIRHVNGAVVTPEFLVYPGRQEYSLDMEERERTGVNAAVQWVVNDNLSSTLDVLYSDFSRQALSFGMQAPLQHAGWSDVHATDSLTAISATKVATPLDGLNQQRGSDSTTYGVGLNTLVSAGQWKFTADLSYSEASAEAKRNAYVPHFVNNNAASDTGLDPTDNIKYDGRTGDVLSVTSTIDYADPASVRAHWNDLQHDELEDEIFEFKFDGKLAVESGVVDSFQFGVFGSDRTKVKDFYQIEDGCRNESLPEDEQVNTCGTGLDLPDHLFKINTIDDYLSEEDGIFPRDFVLITDFDAFSREIGRLRKEPDWQQEFLKPASSSETEESTLGAFTQLNLFGDIGDYAWSGNLGLRYVQTETTSKGHGQEVIEIRRRDDNTNTDTGVDVTYTEPGPLRKSNEYKKLLPSLNLSLDFQNGFFLKTALAKVMTRPTIDAIGVAQSFQHGSAETFARNGGNPELDPFEANQFDLSLEYYGEAGSAYSINLFYKDIESFISQATTSVDTGITIPGFGRLIESVTQFENRKGGEIKGYEVAAIHYFDYLPGVFGGFGLQANYTYADSRDKNLSPFESPGITQPTSGLEGFAKHSYNLVAFYDLDDLQARLAYNWRDDFLKARQGIRTFGLPEHVEAYGQLDFSLSYDINDNITLSAEGINITNERTLEYADVRERVSLIQYSGRRFSAGVRVRY